MQAFTVKTTSFLLKNRILQNPEKRENFCQNLSHYLFNSIPEPYQHINANIFTRHCLQLCQEIAPTLTEAEKTPFTIENCKDRLKLSLQTPFVPQYLTHYNIIDIHFDIHIKDDIVTIYLDFGQMCYPEMSIEKPINHAMLNFETPFSPNDL